MLFGRGVFSLPFGKDSGYIKNGVCVKKFVARIQKVLSEDFIQFFGTHSVIFCEFVEYGHFYLLYCTHVFKSTYWDK